MGNEEIILCSDHAGFQLKEYLKKKLIKDNIKIVDFCENLDNNDDYPDEIGRGAKVISLGKYKKGVFICGTGIGASIAANRYTGIRAALVYNKKTAVLSREHNNSNVIIFGGRIINFRKAYRLFNIWRNTKFLNDERHLRRIKKLDLLGK